MFNNFWYFIPIEFLHWKIPQTVVTFWEFANNYTEFTDQTTRYLESEES